MPHVFLRSIFPICKFQTKFEQKKVAKVVYKVWMSLFLLPFEKCNSEPKKASNELINENGGSHVLVKNWLVRSPHLVAHLLVI